MGKLDAIMKAARAVPTETQSIKITEAAYLDAPVNCPGCKSPPIITQDKWKNWRCFCPGCNRWESMAYPNEGRAIEGWNKSNLKGGKNATA